MSAVLFWVFATLMLLFGILVVILRSPVSSALSLVVSFLGLAALFVMLDAFFIGIIQVLVYAGAVMVLFLFIIMLLDLKAERLRKPNWIALFGGILITFGFVAELVFVLNRFHAGEEAFPPLAGPVDDIPAIGFMLFTNYNLPFQVVGALVLVASIGVVVLSKRELK
jgi:NADH-quinone oxidoreductase subunit J